MNTTEMFDLAETYKPRLECQTSSKDTSEVLGFYYNIVTRDQNQINSNHEQI